MARRPCPRCASSGGALIVRSGVYCTSHRKGALPVAKQLKASPVQPPLGQLLLAQPAQAATGRAPGPATQALQDERARYLPRGVFTYHPVFPASGTGARLVDVDGNRYLDFAGGIGTLNVGHSHPAVVAAIEQQAQQYTHTCAHVATPPPYIELARRLTEITPGAVAQKTLLVNSRAQAVDNALQRARAAT